MRSAIQLILLCHVAILVSCAPKSQTGLEKLPGALTGAEIDSKYEFAKNMSGFGAFASVYNGSTNSEPKVQVAMKIESDHFKNEKAVNEVRVHQILHKKYGGDLLKYHLLNMLDFGKYKDKQNAIILTLAGISSIHAESKKRLWKQPGNQPEWKKMCKMMTHVLDAVEHMHLADVSHLDIKGDNVLFGVESEPAKGASRLPGVTYKNDFYLIDFGNSKDLSKETNVTRFGRFRDLVAIGRFLCSTLEQQMFQSTKEVHESSDIKKYFDARHPYRTFIPEIRTALVGYHQEVRELALKHLTEEQLKTAIDYKKLKSCFK